MIVRQLIVELSQLNPDADVIIYDVDYGAYEPYEVTTREPIISTEEGKVVIS